MEKDDLAGGRSTISEYPQGIEIVVPAKKSYSANLFLALWFMAWIYGEVMILSRLFRYDGDAPDAFMVAWLVGWTLGGLVAVTLWLRNNQGREIIRINKKRMRHIRDYVLFTRSSLYVTADMANLRLNEVDLSMYSMSEGQEFWGLSGGTITFDYGPFSPKFGLGLDEDEARQIIRILRARFPNL